VKNPLVILAVGIATGALAALLYSSAGRPQLEALSPLPEPYYLVLFENDHVRVVEHRLNPGESEPMHSHPPMVVYFMENANVRISGPDGDNFEESLTKGQVVEAEALSHAIENLGDTPVHSILVELKPDTGRDRSTCNLSGTFQSVTVRACACSAPVCLAPYTQRQTEER
jgi:hypothetical protein